MEGISAVLMTAAANAALFVHTDTLGVRRGWAWLAVELRFASLNMTDFSRCEDYVSVEVQLIRELVIAYSAFQPDTRELKTGLTALLKAEVRKFFGSRCLSGADNVVVS